MKWSRWHRPLKHELLLSWVATAKLCRQQEVQVTTLDWRVIWRVRAHIGTVMVVVISHPGIPGHSTWASAHSSCNRICDTVQLGKQIQL